MSDVMRDMPMAMAPRKVRPMPAWKIHFYRQCRLWHGWLSAFAFLALMFFSATGILLNHPEWLGQEDRAPVESRFTLAKDDVATARKAAEPAPALAALVTRTGKVGGVYASGEVDGDEAYLRYEGVSGNTSLVLDLTGSTVEAALRKADTATVLNDLHRGKNAGKAWKLLIDVSAALFLVMSLIGYILFFSLRHRLTQTLLLTVGSLGLLAGIFMLFVP